MIAVYKRELSAYFNGLFGWIFLSVTVFGGGLCTVLFNLLGGTSALSSALFVLSLVSTALIPPIVTLTFTSDNRSRNSLWLSGLPLRKADVRVGKYLAALTLLTLPVAVYALFPPLMASFADLSYGTAYVSLLGYWLMNAALLAVESAVASMFRRPWVALTVCEVMGVVILLLPVLSALFSVFPAATLVCCVLLFVALGAAALIKKKRVAAGLWYAAPAALSVALYFLLPSIYSKHLPNALYAVSLQDRMQGFCAGHLDLPAVALFISVCVLGLFLTACLPVQYGKAGGARK